MLLLGVTKYWDTPIVFYLIVRFLVGWLQCFATPLNNWPHIHVMVGSMVQEMTIHGEVLFLLDLNHLHIVLGIYLLLRFIRVKRIMVELTQSNTKIIQRTGGIIMPLLLSDNCFHVSQDGSSCAPIQMADVLKRTGIALQGWPPSMMTKDTTPVTTTVGVAWATAYILGVVFVYTMLELGYQHILLCPSERRFRRRWFALLFDSLIKLTFQHKCIKRCCSQIYPWVFAPSSSKGSKTRFGRRCLDPSLLEIQKWFKDLLNMIMWVLMDIMVTIIDVMAWILIVVVRSDEFGVFVDITLFLVRATLFFLIYFDDPNAGATEHRRNGIDMFGDISNNNMMPIKKKLLLSRSRLLGLQG